MIRRIIPPLLLVATFIHIVAAATKEHGKDISIAIDTGKSVAASETYTNTAIEPNYGYIDTHLPSQYVDGGTYDAAIHSKRSVIIVPVYEQYDQPKVNTVSVDPAEVPLVLTLKSKSSPLIVNAVHIGSDKGSMEKTKSVDAPHIRVHETLKPVLQELREVVMPRRKITQYVSPVLQKINTFVSADTKGGYGHGSGYAMGQGYYGHGEEYGYGSGSGTGSDYGTMPDNGYNFGNVLESGNGHYGNIPYGSSDSFISHGGRTSRGRGAYGKKGSSKYSGAASLDSIKSFCFHKNFVVFC